MSNINKGLSVSELEDKIIYYSKKYYEGNQEISDYDFDIILQELKELNPKSRALVTGWGYNPNSSPLSKKEHLYGQMKGIDRKPSPEVVREKYKKESYVLTSKLDGASVGVYYNNGKFDFALTRGNGVIGLDISDKIINIVPYNLNTKFTGRIRAEFVLPRDIFDEKYKSQGAASPRNTAAGFLNKKDWNIEDINDFRLISYNVISEEEDFGIDKSLAMLKNWNFNVVNRRVIPSESLTSSSLEYELQSMCIHCGEYIDCDGFVGEDEQGLFAIKWNTESAISTVVGVKYNLSRLGKLSPVVQIEEVQLQDANITNVSGFNAKYIVDNGIGIGAVAKIVRSGDIIPAIIEVISRVTPDIPSVCPECNSPLINDGVDLVCANPNCTGTRLKQLINFVNIVSPVDGLGNSTKIKFFEFFGDNSIEDFINNLVTTYKYDIDYYLNNFRDEVDGIGSTSIVLIKEMLEKLLEPIQANKFLCGLGLKGLGLTYCNKLFSEMTFERFLNTLYNSADISDIACINITGRKSLIENSGFILELSGNLNIVDPIREENIKSSEELKICVTGKLSMTRKEFIDIASKECNAVEVPINKASILITDDKDSNSSKSKIARERGILMLSEEEFKCKYFNK